jgi:hypothetical protein
VQIAFHFISGGGGWGTDYGWYIDDVEVVTNPPVFNNPEGFETNFDDWSVDAGTWEIGKPTSGPNAAHGGTNCAGTVLAGNYGWNMDTRLISPPFPVPASNSPTLRYAQWFKFVNALGVVEINNGTTSSISITNTTITTNAVFSSFDTNTYQLSGAMVTGYSTPFYWNQTIGGWTNATKTLKNVQDTSGYVPKAGYYFEAGTHTPLYGGVNDRVYVGGCHPAATICGRDQLSRLAGNDLDQRGTHGHKYAGRIFWNQLQLYLHHQHHRCYLREQLAAPFDHQSQPGQRFDFQRRLDQCRP